MTGVIHCPHCQGAVSYHVSQGGSAVSCPHCGRAFSIPRPAPAAPAPRRHRITALRRDFVCLGSMCGAKRTVADHEIDGSVRCPECSGKMVSELALLKNLGNPKMRAKFAALGYGMMYTDEARADAEQFVRLCVAHVHVGVDPGVAVSAELDPLGLDRTTGTPAMRAFTASCGFYEWLYEEALARPDGDPTKGAELGVLEAVLDHPLYRNDALHARLAAIRGDPFFPRSGPAGDGFPDLLAETGSVPSLPRPPGAPDNPFTTLDNSRPAGRQRKPTSWLPILKWGGGALVWVVVLGLWLVVKANREQKAETTDDKKSGVVASAPPPNKGERKQPGSPRPHDDAKADPRPKAEKTAPVAPGPPVTANDSKTLRTTLERCARDETALSEFNRTGAKSTFSAANVGVGAGTDAATIMKGEMCIVDAKYDPARRLFVVTAVPSLLVTRRDGKRLVEWPMYYLAFNCPATKDEADLHIAQFDAGLLTLDAEYKLRKCTPLQEEGSVGDPGAKVVTSYMLETEILAVKLGVK